MTLVELAGSVRARTREAARLAADAAEALATRPD